MTSRGVTTLAWVFFLHLTGIYLFTRGFLLTRLALSEVTSCLDGSCTVPATHKRAVVLVIDALRFDFLSPDPPLPASPYHHNVLRLPQELNVVDPSRSLLFDSFADPPTTTLQRIKGITTGSLPTFIDMGSNFGGASIVEDSLISQLRTAGKKVAFMGDDTWTTVFPDAFAFDMCFPYDSFNVEDLHSVDEGVERHLLPLLQSGKSQNWDVLIGHFLGVDHVGHRVGPDHPTMKAKLKQMDNVLRRVVDLLDDDTLLVVLGDHGMDRRGDHGGDGMLETAAALWLYSKGPKLTFPGASIPAQLLPTRLFLGATVPHRFVQQIDLVPSLALLLGLPIPFNNLGTIMPELFWRDKRGTDFGRALDLNTRQVKQYLDAYRSSDSGAELDGAWSKLEQEWAAVETATVNNTARWLAMSVYTRSVLATCRRLWAQFNVFLIGLGLTLLVAGIAAGYALYAKFDEVDAEWESWVAETQWVCIRGMAAGATLGILVYIPLRPYAKDIDALDCVLFSAFLVSSMVIIVTLRSSFVKISFSSLPLPLVLHSLVFASNSFTVWEDRVITFLLLSSIVPFVITGFSAPTSRLRYRILGFSALFAVCVRLMAASTVCREEQQPFCHVTFFASSALALPPLPVLLLSAPAALALPWVIRRFLGISKSDKGVAALVLPWILPGVLLQGCAFWIIEWLDTADVLGPGWGSTLRITRTLLARCAMGGVLAVGLSLWWLVPLCVEINARTAGANPKKEVTVLGFGNAFGAPYIVFWCTFFGLLYTATQLTGQLVLGLAAVAVLAHMEVVDSVRDVRALEAAFASAAPSTLLNADARVPLRPAVTFAEIVPLALLALHTFYRTGHQSVIPSIQWKTAYVLTPTLNYPFSPALVVLNTWGPQFLLALAAPLLALWNVSPLPQPETSKSVHGGAVRASLGMMLYHATLLLGSAASSAWLRRHLMVWKIFAPRFMNAALSLVAVDLAVLLGVGLGVTRIAGRVTKLFGAMSSGTA